ncbi:carbohydrate kinase [Mucilaginibacter koreensis]
MDKLVLCFGEILWDAFGDGKKAGGAPFNVARHLVQQGVNALPASRVGADDSGMELVATLQDADINTLLIQQDEKLPTCEVTVKLDENNHATYTIPEPVSWDNMQPEKWLMEHAEKADVIVFGSLANRKETTLNTLLDVLDNSKALRVFDVNLRPPHYNLDTIETLAAKADVIKMNEEEAAILLSTTYASKNSLADQLAEFRAKFHVQTICITRGENGAVIWHDEKLYEHPGFEITVADTVGAGDSFLATLICGLLKEEPIDTILPRAGAVGAYVASQRGANPVYDEGVIEGIMRG